MEKHVKWGIVGLVAGAFISYVALKVAPPASALTVAPQATSTTGEGSSPTAGNITPGDASALPEPARHDAAVPIDPVQPPPLPTSGSSKEPHPLDTAPGFEYLSKSASEMKDTDFKWTAWRRHQELQKQSRDEVWSTQTESMLRSDIQKSLMAHGVDTSRIELSVVECRAGGCEIQAVGYSADNGKQGIDLQSIVGAQRLGRWGNEFSEEDFLMSLTGGQEGRVLFLVQLSRKKP